MIERIDMMPISLMLELQYINWCVFKGASMPLKAQKVEKIFKVV